MTRYDNPHEQYLPNESPYGDYSRPGILTAVGVISIVIAVLGVAANLGGLMMAMFISTASTMSQTLSTITPPPAATRPAAANPDLTDDSQVSLLGLKRADREFVMGKLSGMQKLDESQLQELNYFLLIDGRSAFPHTGDGLTDLDIKYQVNGSGVSESTGEDDPACAYFTMMRGTLKVYDDKVELARPRSNLPPMSTSLAQSQQAPSPAGFAPLGTAQTNAAIQQVKTMWPDSAPRNAAVEAALKKELKSPSQQLVPVMFARFPISNVLIDSKGITTITFNGGGQLSIDKPGKTVSRINSTYTPPTFKAMPILHVSDWAILLSVIDSLLSAGLAIFLMVAGIQTLRGSPSGSVFHRIFAWTKLPLTILGAIGAITLSRQLGQYISTNATTPGNPATSIFVTMSMILAIVGFIYPIVLLVTFHSRKVREFYHGVVSY